MQNQTKICFVCACEQFKMSGSGSIDSYCQCETCGIFRISPSLFLNVDKNILASFLFYECKVPNKTLLIVNQEETIDLLKDGTNLVTREEIENWYPKSFSEKIDMILLVLAKLSDYDGSWINLWYEQCCSAFFIKRSTRGGSDAIEENLDQIRFVLNYLKENEFVKGDIGADSSFDLALLPEGLKRIDELQKNKSNSKNVFVAMSFAQKMKNIRSAICEAITRSGYIPRIMDEIEHNNQIVPEMLYEIRQSKFVVAELTGHNNGAYYEAGYAAGLGKEVIHVCQKYAFDADGHFDVKQKATILWKTEAELVEALFKRIKATII